jgi:cytochrome c6
MINFTRLLTIGCITLIANWFLLLTPALALNSGSLDSGAQVFGAHCVGCHVNGGNIVRRGKNLKLKTLQRNHVDSLEAIGEIVANGRGIMSAYGDRLSEQEIVDVSAYVLQQAEQEWKNN